MKLVKVVGISGDGLVYNIGTCSVKLLPNFVELNRAQHKGNAQEYLALDQYEIRELVWAELKLGMGKMNLDGKSVSVIINKGIHE